MESNEFATFGPVHLNITDREKSINFWHEVIGLMLRENKEYIEFGTENIPLVVLHPTASTKFKQGYSGLYHLAIHLPNEEEFARMLYRLIKFNWPISTTDHTISKSIYLEDPDGITIEFALETPQRFKEYERENGMLYVIDSNNIKRSVSDYLDIDSVLDKLPDNEMKTISNDAKVGHIHLYVNDLDKAMDFYKLLGFTPNMFYPDFGLGDLSAGGYFKHRIAVNVWQGIGAPQAPQGVAGMEYFNIKIKDKNKLKDIVKNISDIKRNDYGYILNDPAGNKIHLE